MTYRNILICCAALLTSATSILRPGQDSHQPHADSAGASKVISGFIGLPPQLSAYFSLLAASKKENLQIKKELIYAAMQYVQISPKTFPIRYFGPPELTSTVVNATIKTPRIDTLSLQLKSAELMTAIDKESALKIIDEIIVDMSGGNHSAGSFTVPNLRSSYGRLKDILQQLSSPDETTQNKKSAILHRWIYQMNSSYQIAGSIDIINDATIPFDQQIILLDSLSRKIQSIADGDPAFTVALFEDNLPDSLSSLLRNINSRGIDVSRLLEAYRTYLTTNAGIRCGYCIELDKRLSRTNVLNYTFQFNNLVDEYEGKGAVKVGRIKKLVATSQEIRSNDQVDMHNAAILYSSTDENQLRRNIAELIDARSSLGKSDWEKRAETVVKATDEYVDKVVTERSGRRADQTLAAVGQMMALLLDVVDIPEAQEQIASVYMRALGALWSPGKTDEIVFARIRELILRCWGSSSTEQSSVALHKSRLQGIRAGVLGQPDVVGRVADLTVELETDQHECGASERLQ